MYARRRTGFCLIAIAILAAAGGATAARELTLADRVDCRCAIESVYWAHRSWPEGNPGPKPGLAAVLSDDALRAEVEGSLRASVALEQWGRPITTGDLQAEMERMARDSRRTGVLRELFASLHDDPVLIAECLARPLLADRLVDDLAERDPAFANWWREKGPALPAHIAPTAGTLAPVAPLSAASCTNDTWTPTTGAGAPPGRQFHASLWTGSEVVVWGGWESHALALLGKLYDPATNSWRTMTAYPSGSGYPSGANLSAVWTGEQIIFWGGENNTEFGPVYTDAGIRYNPTSNTWHTMSDAFAFLVERAEHSAVWAGWRMFVYGGTNASGALDSGAYYNPIDDSWKVLSRGSVCTSGVSSGHGCLNDDECPGTCSGGVNPGALCAGYFDCYGGCTLSHATLCSTNTDCSVQGLGKCTAPPPGTCSATVGACANVGFHPTAVPSPQAVWTNSKMIVWGGTASASSIYDPATNLWSPMSAAGAPVAENAVWTGSQMIVWGSGSSNAGGRYDPASNSWTPTSTGPGVPAPRAGASAVWTGDEMVVWGGGAYQNTGGRYRPSTDTWAATALTGAPDARKLHTAAWTGTEMMVWGGRTSASGYVATGGRYCATPACALHTWYRDADADGYGDTYVTVDSCAPPPGYVAVSGDCNDTTAGAHPGAQEICGDGIDNDCNGAADNYGFLGGLTHVSVTGTGGGTVSWTPMFDANVYDIVRGSLSVLASSHGNFTVATTDCQANDYFGLSRVDAQAPAAGSGFWYVVRGVNCFNSSSYNSDGATQVGSRDAEIQASPAHCP